MLDANFRLSSNRPLDDPGWSGDFVSAFPAAAEGFLDDDYMASQGLSSQAMRQAYPQSEVIDVVTSQRWMSGKPTLDQESICFQASPGTRQNRDLYSDNPSSSDSPQGRFASMDARQYETHLHPNLGLLYDTHMAGMNDFLPSGAIQDAVPLNLGGSLVCNDLQLSKHGHDPRQFLGSCRQQPTPPSSESSEDESLFLASRKVGAGVNTAVSAHTSALAPSVCEMMGHSPPGKQASHQTQRLGDDVVRLAPGTHVPESHMPAGLRFNPRSLRPASGRRTSLHEGGKRLPNQSGLESNQPRNDPLYQAKPAEDGYFHCPFRKDAQCDHKPVKQKCNYEYVRPFLFIPSTSNV